MADAQTTTDKWCDGCAYKARHDAGARFCRWCSSVAAAVASVTPACKRLIRAIYAQKPRDYRGRHHTGAHSVLDNLGGTHLVYLESMTEAALLDYVKRHNVKLDKAPRKAAPQAEGT